METYIKNNTLHVTLSQAENNAVHCAAWIAPTCQADRDLATLGRAILEQIDKTHKERFQRTGAATPVLVSVEVPPARPDGLAAQRERWARDAATWTGYGLETCRLVARHAGNEGEATGILEMAAMGGLSPEAVVAKLEGRGQ